MKSTRLLPSESNCALATGEGWYALFDRAKWMTPLLRVMWPEDDQRFGVHGIYRFRSPVPDATLNEILLAAETIMNRGPSVTGVLELEFAAGVRAALMMTGEQMRAEIAVALLGKNA